MLFALIFLGAGIAVWVAAGVIVFSARKQLRKTDLMRRVETSKTAEVAGFPAGTPVEVKGTLRCEEPLRSEMAGHECAYYLSQVIHEYNVREYDSDGDLRTRRRTEVMASNERFAPFGVEDDSGVVGIRGEGAEVDALEVMNRFENNTGKEGSFALGGLTVNLGGGASTIGYRYVEGVLPIDAPVYVLGVVREDGHIGAPADEGGEMRFLISHRSEEQLEKKYKRSALLRGLLAVALFLFGSIFVIIGLIAGISVLGAAA
ncbi:MAG: E3 ubiquitin ligase family protein [Actinomycetota bacterium]|nr:E3 ubiquitin ligase family protein [Actinomycetota bacterium]